MRKRFVVKKWIAIIAVAVVAVIGLRYVYRKHLTVDDFLSFNRPPGPIGIVAGDPLKRLGVRADELLPVASSGRVTFAGKTRYLNGAKAVVVQTIDDASDLVGPTLDLFDKYDIKATIFIDTAMRGVPPSGRPALWSRLQAAIANGDEIGAHSRRHQCKWPSDALFCFTAFDNYEVTGARDDILQHTDQPYVWSWAYPCGNCESREFVQRKVAAAGYLVARTYPGERENQEVVPDLRTYGSNPYDIGYTQVMQGQGGIAKSGRTDVAALNAKFDQVYDEGGIYSVISHPQWMDLKPGGYVARHLSHISGRTDVWYVPMGLLYAYHTSEEKTDIRALAPEPNISRFAVYNSLDPKTYPTSITLRFAIPYGFKITGVTAGSNKLMERDSKLLTDRWNESYFRIVGGELLVTVRPNCILSISYASPANMSRSTERG